MAEEDVRNILQGLQLSQQQRAEAIRAGLEQQRITNENENAKARLEVEKQAHKDQTDYQKAVLKATQSLHEVQRLKDFQDIGMNAERGAPIPGAVQVGETPDTTTLQIPGMTNEQGVAPGIIGNVPLPQEITIRKPAKVAEDETTLAEPKVRMQARLQQDIADRQQALERIKTDWEAKKQVESIKSAEMIARGHDAARVAAVNITHATGQDINPEAIAPYVQGIGNLQYSATDIRKIFPDKKASDAVFKAARDAGFQIPDENQKKTAEALTGATNGIPLFKEYLALEDEAGSNPMKLLQLTPQLLAKQKQIKEALVNAATALGQTRLSDSRVKAMDQAYTPNILGPGSGAINKDKFNQYERLLHDLFDNKVGGLSDSQKTMLKARTGLLDHQSKKVLIIRDGQKGLVSPQFVKPTDQVVQ